MKSSQKKAKEVSSNKNAWSFKEKQEQATKLKNERQSKETLEGEQKAEWKWLKPKRTKQTEKTTRREGQEGGEGGQCENGEWAIC